MTTLQNEIFTLTINEAEGWFSIEPKDKKLPAINACISRHEIPD